MIYALVLIIGIAAGAAALDFINDSSEEHIDNRLNGFNKQK